jgi:hypothetical protein
MDLVHFYDIIIAENVGTSGSEPPYPEGGDCRKLRCFEMVLDTFSDIAATGLDPFFFEIRLLAEQKWTKLYYKHVFGTQKISKQGF